jgi:hypothetical protein
MAQRPRWPDHGRIGLPFGGQAGAGLCLNAQLFGRAGAGSERAFWPFRHQPCFWRGGSNALVLHGIDQWRNSCHRHGHECGGRQGHRHRHRHDRGRTVQAELMLAAGLFSMCVTLYLAFYLRVVGRSLLHVRSFSVHHIKVGPTSPLKLTPVGISGPATHCGWRALSRRDFSRPAVFTNSKYAVASYL